jgi:hypothetical protein
VQEIVLCGSISLAFTTYLFTTLYCCRLFAASLQLVNGGNIAFDTVSGAAMPQLLVHDLLMQDRQKDFLVPSHHARKVTAVDVTV